MNELKNFIKGDWVVPDLTLPGQLCDANSGEVLGKQPGSSTRQIEQALMSASAAHADGRWGLMPVTARADKLEQIAEALADKVKALAHVDALQTGVVISLTSRLAQICAAAFHAAAGLLRQPDTTSPLPGPHGALLVERLPLGVAAVIAPWNAPSGIACHKLASALAAGCPTLLKPSEWAPGSAQLIAEAVVAADLPDGVFQLLHGDGDTGHPLVADARVAAVSFTGGLQGGRAVAHACAENIKPAQLELGGNNPLIVLADANLETTAEGIVTAMITLNGQWCRALGRLLVHSHCKQPLLDRIEEKMQAVNIGSSLDPTATMGPLVHAAHRDHVQASIGRYADLGGLCINYGNLPALGGWFVRPTLITGLKPALTLEEVFGPVATVHEFNRDEEAIRLANQTPYGLAAYVFGEEQHAWQVARQMTTGITKINGVTILNLNPSAPRPAWGLSGLGDEGTRETYEFFRGSRIIGVAARHGQKHTPDQQQQ